MKIRRFILCFCVCAALLTPCGLKAGVDEPYDPGQNSMTGGGALLGIGIYALTHPDALNSLSNIGKEEDKKEGVGQKSEVDKKVDDAIKKAWEDKQ